MLNKIKLTQATMETIRVKTTIRVDKEVETEISLPFCYKIDGVALNYYHLIYRQKKNDSHPYGLAYIVEYNDVSPRRVVYFEDLKEHKLIGHYKQSIGNELTKDEFEAQFQEYIKECNDFFKNI